jgi:hypothetical protein
MIIILFGILDLLASIMLVLTHLNILSWQKSIGFAMYLFIKSYMFKGDLMSLVDFLIGVYFIMMILGFRSILVYLFALFLFQKAFFSLKR